MAEAGHQGGGATGDVKISCRNVWKVYGPEPDRFFEDFRLFELDRPFELDLRPLEVDRPREPANRLSGNGQVFAP